ncbi:MAG: beta-ketoacyl-ACP synthase 3, partial [Muribaculaceae bacterium]|nr:beta-ketoacyl-ACP synthase 3 [Muribaculaceae bacterium]
MQHAIISGIASYVPDDVLDNDMLSKMVDTNDEWITTRVGIKERRILKEEGKGSSFLGMKAVEKLLAETGTSREDVDLLICATSNPDYRFPSTASVILHECGLRQAYGYDIQAACAGFIVTMQAARAYIESGLYKKIIVVCAEKMSSMTNYDDRATCPLFGDAAAAVLVEPSDEPLGVIDGEFHVDGSGLPHLLMKAGGSVKPASHETVDAGEHFIYQEGRSVYKAAVSDMLSSSQNVMRRNGLSVDDVDWFVPHQANLRI